MELVRTNNKAYSNYKLKVKSILQYLSYFLKKLRHTNPVNDSLSKNLKSR